MKDNFPSKVRPTNCEKSEKKKQHYDTMSNEGNVLQSTASQRDIFYSTNEQQDSTKKNDASLTTSFDKNTNRISSNTSYIPFEKSSEISHTSTATHDKELSSMNDNDILEECNFCSSRILKRQMAMHINVLHPSASVSSSCQNKSSHTWNDCIQPDPLPEEGVLQSSNGETSFHESETGQSLTLLYNESQEHQCMPQTTNTVNDPYMNATSSNDTEQSVVNHPTSIEPCRLCHLTFESVEEASDHEMAHRLQEEEDEHLTSLDPDQYYQVILSSFQGQTETNQTTSEPQETRETNETSHNYVLPVVSFISDRNPTVWIAASSQNRDQGNGPSPPNERHPLIAPISLLTEQLVSGTSPLSLEEWITRLRFGHLNGTDRATVESQSDATPSQVVQSLPVHSYNTLSTAPQNENLGTLDVDPDMCMICLDEYNSNDQLRQLPCFHYFHVPCIDSWLEKSQLCPACKRSVLPKESINTQQETQQSTCENS